MLNSTYLGIQNPLKSNHMTFRIKVKEMISHERYKTHTHTHTHARARARVQDSYNMLPDMYDMKNKHNIRTEVNRAYNKL